MDPYFALTLVTAVIYQRQQAKGHLATITVDGKSCTKQSSSFTKDELRDCFTLKEGCRCDTKDKVGAQWPDYGKFLRKIDPALLDATTSSHRLACGRGCAKSHKPGM